MLCVTSWLMGCADPKASNAAGTGERCGLA